MLIPAAYVGMSVSLTAVDEEDEDAGSHTSLLGSLSSRGPSGLPVGHGGRRARLVMSSRPASGEYIDEPTVAETSLPWRRRDGNSPATSIDPPCTQIPTQTYTGIHKNFIEP